MKKLKNTTNDTIKEISNILDKDYFHVCFSLNIDNLEWIIYYKNMEDEEFWSENNTSLLSSDKNCIADIYELRDIFQNIKNRYLKQSHYEIFKETTQLYWSINELKQEAYRGMSFLFTIYTISMCIISAITNNILLSLSSLFLTLLCGIYMIVKNKKIIKITSKKRKELMDNFLRVKMKNDSKKIVEEIKRELK